MSTAIAFPDGITRWVNFEKTVSNGWRFTWGNRSFMAQRDEAGFAHRDWILYEYDGPRDAGRPFQGRPDITVEDMLESRAACVIAAYKAVSWRGSAEVAL